MLMLLILVGLPHQETFPFHSRAWGVNSGFPKLFLVSVHVHTVFASYLLPWSMSLMLLICCLERMDPVT